MNLLERASFEEKEYTFKVSVDSGNSRDHRIELEPEQFLGIAEVGWKYEVPESTNAYGWPRIPVRISIPGVLSDTVSSPHEFSPVRLIKERANIVLQNNSEVDVVVHFNIKGTLVTPKSGMDVSENEILGYTMLDSSHKGMLALSGAFGQTPNALTGQDPLALEQKQEKALPDSQLERSALLSLLIGDLFLLQEELDVEIGSSDLKKLAELLLDKGWKR